MLLGYRWGVTLAEGKFGGPQRAPFHVTMGDLATTTGQTDHAGNPRAAVSTGINPLGTNVNSRFLFLARAVVELNLAVGGDAGAQVLQSAAQSQRCRQSW